jgi:hypothetical protein
LIVDVTKGNNTVTFPQGGTNHTVKGFDALPGYDLASGVGTVDAAKFVPELAATGCSHRMAGAACRGGPRPPSPSMIDLNHRRLYGGLRRRRDRAVIVAVVTEPTIEVCPISIFCCPRPTCV